MGNIKRKVREAVNTSTRNVVDVSEQILGNGKKSLKYISGKLKEKAGDFPGKLKNAARDISGKLKDTAGNAPGELKDTARDISGKFLDTVRDISGKLKYTARNAPGKLTDTACAISGNMLDKARYISRMFLDTAWVISGKIRDTTNDVLRNPIEIVKNIPEKAKDLAGDIQLPGSLRGHALIDNLEKSKDNALNISKRFTGFAVNLLRGVRNVARNTSLALKDKGRGIQGTPDDAQGDIPIHRAKGILDDLPKSPQTAHLKRCFSDLPPLVIGRADETKICRTIRGNIECYKDNAPATVLRGFDLWKVRASVTAYLTRNGYQRLHCDALKEKQLASCGVVTSTSRLSLAALAGAATYTVVISVS